MVSAETLPLSGNGAWNNIYDTPGKFGLELVASIDYSTFHPSFDVLETGLRPFLTAARETGCRHMCHAVWEMYFGDLWANQWLSVVGIGDL